MERLKKDWITNGLIDFEYKKYMLLAYLKHVEKHFNETKLYPFMNDLISCYEDAKLLKSEKKRIKEEFPKSISRLDLTKLQVVYQEIYHDDQLPQEIEEILDYAIPTIEQTLRLGKDLHDEVVDELNIEPIGIMPLYKDEGYLFIESSCQQETAIYQFHIRKFILHNENYRGVHLNLLDKIVRGIGDTYEYLKLKLIKTYKDLPNPATFLIQSGRPLPWQETQYPMSKRLLLQAITELA
jgi:hypothetical protein